MAEQFDPYRKWLGIPPEEQPPNHYRLLGIGLFEADGDVIQEAADRQMSHVQRHKLGQYAAVSQKLLNELSAAKLCLLKPDQKAAYDGQLRQKQTPGIPAAGAPPLVVPGAATFPAAAQPPINQAQSAFAAQQSGILRARPVAAQPVRQPVIPLDDSATDEAADDSAEDTSDFSMPDAAPRNRKGRANASRKAGGKKSASNPLVIGGVIAAGVAVVAGLALISGGTKSPPAVARAKVDSSARPAPENTQPAPERHSPPIDETPSTQASPAAKEHPDASPQPDEAPPSEQSPADGSSEPTPVASGEATDLLAIVHVNSKMAVGKWAKSKKGLTLLASDISFPRVILPYAPPTEYQLELMLEPQPSAEVIVGLVAGGKQFTVILDGWGGSTSGIARIDDKPGNENDSTHQGSVLTPRQANQLLFTVQGDSIRVDSNGSNVIDWHGAFDRLGLAAWAQDIPDKRALFLGGATGTAFRIRSLRLVTISGSGQELTEPVVIPAPVARVETPPAAEPPAPPNAEPAAATRAHFSLANPGFAPAPFQALAVGSDARLLVLSGFKSNPDLNVQFWNLTKRRVDSSVYASFGPGYGAMFSPDGERLFVGSEGRVVTFLKINPTSFTSSAEYTNLGARPILCVSVSPDGRLLAGGGSDGLAVWDTTADPNKPSFKWQHPRSEQVTALAFAAGGKWLLAGCGGTCNLDTRETRGSSDYKLRAWDVSSGQTKEIEGHRGGIWSLAVSADGSKAASASEDGTLRIWDIKTFRSRQTLSGHDGPVYAVALSADGQTVVSGGADKTVRIWNANTGKETDNFSGHTGVIRAVALTMDGKLAVSASDDGTVRLWELAPQTTRPIMALTPAQPAAKRLPTPDKAEVETATKLVREVFADDYKQAKKPPDKLALAEKLLAQSGDSQSDTERYALLVEARSLAVAGDSPALAIQIVERTGDRFEIDVVRETADLVEQPAKDSLSTAARKEMAEALLPIADAAIARDEYEIGRRLLVAASQAARKANDAALTKQLLARMIEVNDSKKMFDAYSKAAEKLKDSPDEADENLAVGKYLCFLKQDWEHGLAHLAKGSDPALQQVAALEVQNPSTPEEQVKIGDLWWALVEPAKGKEKSDYADRCEKWYSAALPGLKGLSQTKIAKRIEEVIAIHKSSGASSGSEGGTKSVSGATASKGLTSRLRMAIKKDQLTRTRLFGAATGTQYIELPPAGVVLVGFNYTLDPQWNAVASLQPIYATGKGPTNGLLLGVPVGEVKTVLADKGFAVAGLRGDGSFWVNGFEVIFKKLAANGLDGGSTYSSPWIGFGNRRIRTTVGDTDQPVIGIFGQVGDRGNRVGSVGLIQPAAVK